MMRLALRDWQDSPIGPGARIWAASSGFSSAAAPGAPILGWTADEALLDRTGRRVLGFPFGPWWRRHGAVRGDDFSTSTSTVLRPPAAQTAEGRLPRCWRLADPVDVRRAFAGWTIGTPEDGRSASPRGCTNRGGNGLQPLDDSGAWMVAARSAQQPGGPRRTILLVRRFSTLFLEGGEGYPPSEAAGRSRPRAASGFCVALWASSRIPAGGAAPARPTRTLRRCWRPASTPDGQCPAPDGGPLVGLALASGFCGDG